MARGGDSIAGKFTAKVTGLKTTMGNLKKAGDQWKRAVAAGLYLEASNVMGRSKRLVPVDQGPLRASGYVTLPEESGSRVTVELGYGGPAKDYAIKQHEDLTLNHPDGGQARFLSAAVEERESKIASNIAKLAKVAFERGQGPLRGPMPTTPDEGGGA